MTDKLYIPHSKPWLISKDRTSIEKVLMSNMIARGTQVEKFENLVAKYLNARYAIAQGSGASAIILALKCLKIEKNDEVIIPTYVCRSVYESVLSVGANPIICDVNSQGVLDENSISSRITSKTKAIIAVHTFGYPCNISKIRNFGVPIIEDACQAFGMKLQHESNSSAATVGDIGILSFHATKCLTTGEGGMLITNSEKYYSEAKKLVHGSHVLSQRCYSPMSDLQASLGISQLKRYDEFLKRREQIKKSYLQAVDLQEFFKHDNVDTNVLFRFILRSNEAFEVLEDRFRNYNIIIRRGVDQLLHRMIELNDGDYNQAVNLFETSISIPFYPNLSDTEVKNICVAIVKIGRQ